MEQLFENAAINSSSACVTIRFSKPAGLSLKLTGGSSFLYIKESL